MSGGLGSEVWWRNPDFEESKTPEQGSLVPAFLLCGISRLLVNPQQLNIKHQCGVRADWRAWVAARAVGKVAWDEQAILASDFHQLQAFGPATNHSVQREAASDYYLWFFDSNVSHALF